MENPKEIAELFKKFSASLRAFIRSKVADEMAAADIMQDVFLKIHDKIDSIRNSTKLQAWIYQITRNQIADYYRSHKKQLPVSEFILPEAEETSPEIMAEALQDMVKMMDNLPPEYCEALCLTELGGMSQKDYATKVGISYSGAKSRVQRAKIMLRNTLMMCCHYQFDKYGTVIDIHPKGCCCCHKTP